MTHQAWLWVSFGILVSGILYIDLFLAGRKHRAVGVKEAAVWTLIWMSLALLFCLGIAIYVSREKALQFLTGYLIEQSLSVDNLFVFIMLFTYFGITPEHQPRVLKWGILGAVVMRLVLILAGTVLVRRFEWIFMLFGALLLYTAWGMAFGGDKQHDPEKSHAFRLARRFLPLTGYHGDAFFARIGGILHATPLFMAVAVLEVSDLVFAMDSIPAIFSITTDTFVVYTSNIFAILGLRALFFLISGLMRLFIHLKYGVSLILAFVGVKMLLMRYVHISTPVSLLFILLALAASVAASLVFKPKES